MASWEELDQYLYELREELKAEAYILTDASKGQLSPPDGYSKEIINRFEPAWRFLEGRHKKNFLRRGRGRRVIHIGTEPDFIAEFLLGAYVLIMLVPVPLLIPSQSSEGKNLEINGFPVFAQIKPYHLKESEIELILDKSHPILETMIAGLPPLDGGGRRVAQVLRF